MELSANTEAFIISILYFIFSPGSLRYGDIYRRRCHTFPLLILLISTSVTVYPHWSITIRQLKQSCWKICLNCVKHNIKQCCPGLMAVVYGWNCFYSTLRHHPCAASSGVTDSSRQTVHLTTGGDHSWRCCPQTAAQHKAEMIQP